MEVPEAKAFSPHLFSQMAKLILVGSRWLLLRFQAAAAAAAAAADISADMSAAWQMVRKRSR